MKLDRALQLELLNALEDAHPSGLDLAIADAINEKHTEEKVFSNLIYLEGHGLLESGLLPGFSGMLWNVDAAKITSKGRDFIADDGGLSAILGVVTVKLHDDTVRSLLIQRIEDAEGDATVKGELVKQVRALPAEALKTLTTRALEAGLRSLPNAIQLLHTWLAHA